MSGVIRMLPTLLRAEARRDVLVVIPCVTFWMLAGCSDNVRRPTAAELAGFMRDRPSGASVDTARISQARLPSGPYRVVPGDVLQIEMPTILDPQAAEAGAGVKTAYQTYSTRVGEDGTILLPVVGNVQVAGKSLAQIEAAIVGLYHPKYVKVRMPIYASVIEYKTYRVSIIGAVVKPGIYQLRHDQMTLVSLLMEAGNIVDEGAALIEITPAVPSEEDAAMPEMSVRSDADVPAAGHDPTRVVFAREGPLRTTGWLSLERPNGAPVRDWLDLDSPFQRGAFLHRATDGATDFPAENLGAKLVQLATYLESTSVQEELATGLDGVGWQAVDRGRFETRVKAPELRRVALREPEGRPSPGRVVLPVRGLNMPFADVALREGDSVSVQRPQQQSVAVVGLVNNPGNMPYPLDARYTLIEAIAFAGGLNLVADPRYVSVYRLQADGTVRGVTVQLVDPKRDQELTQVMSMAIRPGDVVSVENTRRTRTNLFLDRVFRVSLGLYLDPNRIWNSN